MQGNKDVNQSSPPSVSGLDASSSQKLQMPPARLLASPGTSIHASLQDPPGVQMHATSLVVQQLQQEVEELSVSWRCSVGSLLPVLPWLSHALQPGAGAAGNKQGLHFASNAASRACVCSKQSYTHAGLQCPHCWDSLTCRRTGRDCRFASCLCAI